MTLRHIDPGRGSGRQLDVDPVFLRTMAYVVDIFAFSRGILLVFRPLRTLSCHRDSVELNSCLLAALRLIFVF